MIDSAGSVLLTYILTAFVISVGLLVMEIRFSPVSVSLTSQPSRPHNIGYFKWYWPYALPATAIFLLAEAAALVIQSRALGVLELLDILGRIGAVLIAFIPAVQLRNRIMSGLTASKGDEWLRVVSMGLAVYFTIRAAGAITGLLPRVT